MLSSQPDSRRILTYGLDEALLHTRQLLLEQAGYTVDTENVFEFLTRKERNCYTDSDSGEVVSAEAGSLPALYYIFLHESIQVADISHRAGQAGPPLSFTNGAPNQLVHGIWNGYSRPSILRLQCLHAIVDNHRYDSSSYHSFESVCN